MTISLWRYSHLALAVVSSLFLILVSITGVILAVEPITHQSKGYSVADLDEVSLATAIQKMKQNYEEVFSLEVEPSGFVIASVLTESFETEDIYIRPKTGEKLGTVAKRPEIYSFATNLHRSLFLKSVGRFFVGLVSFLLFLIALTGLWLLAKRQGGFLKIFSKVQKEYFEMRYHVILSRFFFIPIIILALSGVYLSAEKFELLPKADLEPHKSTLSENVQTFEDVADIPFLKNTKLSNLRKLDFPFSEDAEDFFHIALKEREIRLNQVTGKIEASAAYPFVTLASRLSFKLHTGVGNVWWSIILLLASASILFFMYSGFVMTLRRRKKLPSVAKMPAKDASDFIVLVGSETGSTFEFAIRLCNALSVSGKQVFLDELNNYSVYKKAKHLIILTATYGEGEPPTNARKFETLINTVRQPSIINYCVVGFGSLEYPNYCEFAIKVDSLLENKNEFQKLLPLYKINNANSVDFQKWAKKWSEKTEIPLKIEPTKSKKKRKEISFEVIHKTELNIDNTFLLWLKPKQKVKFTSGDLLSLIPHNSEIARQYSIAKLGDAILLSIKKHEFGKGSSFLFNSKKGDIINASLETNAHFHFPKKTRSVLLIANGTGIAPFLGMLENHKSSTIKVLWGGRHQHSFEIYQDVVNSAIVNNANFYIDKCYSQTEGKEYVQDLVEKQQDEIISIIKNQGTIMICGSLAMQHGVLEVLEKILKVHGTSIDTLINNQQLKMDCY